MFENNDCDYFDAKQVSEELDIDTFEELEYTNKRSHTPAYSLKDAPRYNPGCIFRAILNKKSERFNRTKKCGVSKYVMDIFAYSFNNDPNRFINDEDMLNGLSEDTYRYLNRIDGKRYPIEALYESIDKDKKFLSDEERKERNIPTTVKNLALMKQQLPTKISESLKGHVVWDGPEIYGAMDIDTYLDDINVVEKSYDGAILPYVLIKFINDKLIKNKVITIYRLMINTEFHDNKIDIGDGETVIISLPGSCEKYIDYVNDDDYRSIMYDTNEWNSGKRKHGKNTGKTIG